MLMVIGDVLFPRFKIKLVQFSFPEIYHEFEAITHIEMVHSLLNELYVSMLMTITYLLAHKVGKKMFLSLLQLQVVS
jgi:hypothetical protein